ncbi:hypothetical protein TK45_02495 [Bowmanella sp. JS7-9]|nr:hypothetical protein TK45_02495 [Bowmanella sp. JS7-9]
MIQPACAYIGLRYARASKSNHFIAFINFFSVVGIMLGIAALITVSSVMNGFEEQLKQRILGLQAQLVVDTRNLSEGQKQAISLIPEVSAVSAYVETEGLIQSPRGLQGVQLQGIDPDVMQQASILHEHLLYGRLNNLAAGEYGVIIGYPLARELGVQPGNKIRIVLGGATLHTPFGPMPAQRLFTVVGVYSLSSELDGRVVMTHVDDLTRVLRKKPADLQQSRLFLHDAFAWHEVSQQIKHITDAPQRNWREQQGKLFDAVKMEKNMMSLMLMLIVLVAAFNIVSALAMVVTEKHSDIAILQTQGMSPAGITQIFLINGLYNGVKGTALGLLVGLLLAWQLNTLLGMLGVHLALPDDQGLPVVIEPLQIVVIIGAALLMSLLASLYPARRAARVLPAQALRYE